MKCEKCKTDCLRDEVDIGVGVIYGPWGCPNCAWSEDPYYDLSEGKKNPNIDQYGGYHPATEPIDPNTIPF